MKLSKLAIVVLLCMFVSSCGSTKALKAWEARDKMLLGAFEVGNVIDAGQTIYALNRPERYEEVNPLFQSKDALYIGWAASSIAVPLVAHYIGKEKPWYRTAFLGAMNVMKWLCVANNEFIAEVGWEFD